MRSKNEAEFLSWESETFAVSSLGYFGLLFDFRWIPSVWQLRQFRYWFIQVQSLQRSFIRRWVWSDRFHQLEIFFFQYSSEQLVCGTMNWTSKFWVLFRNDSGFLNTDRFVRGKLWLPLWILVSFGTLNISSFRLKVNFISKTTPFHWPQLHWRRICNIGSEELGLQREALLLRQTTRTSKLWWKSVSLDSSKLLEIRRWKHLIDRPLSCDVLSSLIVQFIAADWLQPIWPVSSWLGPRHPSFTFLPCIHYSLCYQSGLEIHRIILNPSETKPIQPNQWNKKKIILKRRRRRRRGRKDGVCPWSYFSYRMSILIIRVNETRKSSL